MKQQIHFRYYNPGLHMGVVDIKQVYLLEPVLTPLKVEVYRGKLIYRARGSNRRISYSQLKKGLLKRSFLAEEDVPDWL